MSIRILQVVSDSGRRGAQVFGLDLGEALTALGHTVSTVALAPGSTPNPLPVRTLGRTRKGVTTWQALRTEMAEADVVIAHGSVTLPASAVAGAGLSTPFIYRSIGDPLYWANTGYRRLRVRTFLRRAAAVAALWPGSAHALVDRLGVDPAKITVVPNGVPANRFPVQTGVRRKVARRGFHLAPDASVLLYAGSLTSEKNVHAVIDVVSLEPSWQLLIVGDGPLRTSLEDHGREAAPGRVFFTGNVDDPSAAFAAADVCVMLSRSEGLPAVLIEAGLSGVPAVATNVGGVREIVRSGQTGALLADDAPTTVRRDIARVLTHSESYGQEARKWCLEHFEIGVVARKWDKLVKAVLTTSSS